MTSLSNKSPNESLSDEPPEGWAAAFAHHLGLRTPAAHRRAWWAVSALVCFAYGFFGWLRFRGVHNQTFDLAFYTRMAWGMAEGDLWMPLLDAHIFGLHLSPILLPLGWLGRWLGTANVLIAAGALSAWWAALSMAKLGRRCLGRRAGGPDSSLALAGGWLGVAMVLLYPNLGHVLSYEAHPGTLALGPLAFALERLEARRARGVVVGCIGVLLCREDLAMLTAILGLLLVLQGARRMGAGLTLLSLAWLGLFVGVLHPTYAPDGGSFDQHLGHWGDSPGAVIAAWIRNPSALWAYLMEAPRSTYLPRILAPLCLLPLLAPRYLLVAAPVLALNLVSAFPTTTQLDSHYLSLAVPPLAAAALSAMGRLPKPSLVGTALALALVASYAVAGFWGGRAFVPDARTEAAERVLALIPDEAAVQAPDALLPHLAERRRFHRGTFRPGEEDRGDGWIVLDVRHRDRYAGQATLLRTVEEPVVRDWLSREVEVVAHAHPFLLLRRGGDPRHTPFRDGHATAGGVRLSGCLVWLGAEPFDAEADEAGGADAPDVRLRFRATGACPADTALRFGDGRVDLLFDGAWSPAHLRAGDRVWSVHRDVDLSGLSVGLIRTSGAPPAHGDPRSVPLRSLSAP